jgi:recombination protein RecT
MSTGKAVELRSKQDGLKHLVAKAADSVESVLPKHMNRERFLKVYLLAAVKQPDLYNCSPESLLQALMQAAQLGLEVNSPLGSAYLVPFKGTAVLIPGYRGLIDLARRSGVCTAIEAHVVYKDDEFDWVQGTAPTISHRPNLLGARLDEDVVAAYAIAWFEDGHTQMEVLTRRDIDKVRASSRAGAYGPWKDWFAEMCRKTAVKRLAKYLPLTTEMADAIELDTRAETGEVGSVTGMDDRQGLQRHLQETTKQKLADLREKLADQAEATDTETRDMFAEETEAQA